MVSYFFDTSAIIKAYRLESGTDWINGVIGQKPSPRISISELVRVEVPSTLYRIEREKQIDEAMTNWAYNRFERDIRLSEPTYNQRKYIVISITSTIIERAASLLEKYRRGSPNALRSLDAIQLACAIIARDTLAASERDEMVFVTADKQLIGSAGNEGFSATNPVFPFSVP